MMDVTARFLYNDFLRELFPMPDCGFSTGQPADMRLYCTPGGNLYEERLFNDSLTFAIGGGNGYALVGEYPGRLPYSGPASTTINIEKQLLNKFRVNSVTRWLD